MKHIIAVLLYIIVLILFRISEDKSWWFIYFAFLAGYFKDFYDGSIFKK